MKFCDAADNTGERERADDTNIVSHLLSKFKKCYSHCHRLWNLAFAIEALCLAKIYLILNTR